MILVISALFPPEPVVSAAIAHDLALVLSETHIVKVVTPKPTRPHGFFFDKNPRKKDAFEQIILNSYTCSGSKFFGRFRESYSFGRQASRYIKSKHSEIACIYMNVWPLFAQSLIVKAARKYSIPSVVHVQDVYPESLSTKIPLFKGIINIILRPIDRYTLRKSSAIVVVSDRMKNMLAETRSISSGKIDVIRNWQDEHEFISQGKLKKTIKNELAGNQPFTFMYLGNIGPVSRVDFLIRGFISSELYDARLVIAGNGSRKEECIAIANRFNSGQIEFWDVPAGKVPEIQDNADILLLAVKPGAASSSVPSKLPAYLFSGKPVIACVDDDSDTADTIKEAGCGWVIAPDDIGALAKSMQSACFIHKKELNIYGRKGFEYAEKHFSKKDNLSRLVNIIYQNEV